MKKYKHWVWFDTLRLKKVKEFLEKGKDFKIVNVYAHPSRICVYILEIESNNCYNDLDLNVNDGYGILHRYARKPKLDKPLTNNFIRVYGELPKLATC